MHDNIAPRARRHRSYRRLPGDLLLVACGVMDRASLRAAYHPSVNAFQVDVREPGAWWRPGRLVARRITPNLRTNAGGEWQFGQMAGGGGTDIAAFIALSNDASAPNVTDATLASEIATNGLARVRGTVTHSAITGSGSSTIQGTYTTSYTFTFSGSSQGVQKVGLFTRLSGGTLVFESTFSPLTVTTNQQLVVNHLVSY